jgi:sec-independent protein translocase protein TatC
MAELPESAGGEETPEQETGMTVFEHLQELRKRLILALLGTVPGMVVAWYFKEILLEFLLAPLSRAWMALGMPEPVIHFANPVDPFIAYLKIAIVAGLLFSSPWIFWQIWAFVAPGLYRREKRLAIPFVIGSTVFFCGGAFFGYGAVFPPAFELFLGMAGTLPQGSIDLQPTIMLTEYLNLATRLLLAFGVVFEIPVAIAFLSLAGLVNWKQLLKFGRVWVVMSAVLAAMLTPPEISSQLMMLVPLVVLYFLSIGLAYLLGPRPQAEPGDGDQNQGVAG